MYIIIAGCGTIGATLALSLSQENHDVVVIDNDSSHFKLLGSGFNGMTVTGMPIDEDILRSAGIEQADALAAVTNDDNMNVMVSQVAKELFAVPKVITRLYDPTREGVFHRMGMTTICPTKLAVTRIMEMLFPDENAVSLDVLGLHLECRAIRPARNMIGKSVLAYKKESVLGIIRNKRFLSANADTAIEAEDVLLVANVKIEGEPLCI